jgi:hypothetical protein
MTDEKIKKILRDGYVYEIPRCESAGISIQDRRVDIDVNTAFDEHYFTPKKAREIAHAILLATEVSEEK